MKEIKGWIAFFVWMVVVIWGGVEFAQEKSKNINHSGTKLEIQVATDRYVDIQAESEVIVAAASSSFFVLRKNDEVIIGVLTEPPLGWSDDLYFTAGPQILSNGRWVVEIGNPTLSLTGSTQIKVVEVVTSSKINDINFEIFLLGLAIWLMGLLIYAIVFDS